MSACACSNDSMSMRSTSWSVRPYDGLTSIVCAMSVRSSDAATLRIPFASIWNLTSIRGRPAGIGGIPRSLNRASERQSFASSRSPCST